MALTRSTESEKIMCKFNVRFEDDDNYYTNRDSISLYKITIMQY